MLSVEEIQRKRTQTIRVSRVHGTRTRTHAYIIYLVSWKVNKCIKSNNSNIC